MPDLKTTALYLQHKKHNAYMVDFHGWLMPLHYGSQIQEHHAVRNDAGMFDVSHMTIIDLSGNNISLFLRYLLANDVAKLTLPGKALYTAMLTPDGGVMDDLIVYYIDERHYRLIVNSATREKDLSWITQQAIPFDIHIHVRDDLSLISVQGPKAIAKVTPLLTPEQQRDIAGMKPFFGLQTGDMFIATTGYTGEKGFEIALLSDQASYLWQQLAEAGVECCGLGARDTLRLEAGMNLYGQEMDENTSPLVANMAWTLSLEPQTRDFIGRKAVEAQRDTITDALKGLVLLGKGMLRNELQVVCEDSEGNPHYGTITSGSYSPTLNCSIALARIPLNMKPYATVMLRGAPQAVRIVDPIFVRHGVSVID